MKYVLLSLKCYQLKDKFFKNLDLAKKQCMWFSFKTHPDLSVGNLLKNVCASMCVRVCSLCIRCQMNGVGSNYCECVN